MKTAVAQSAAINIQGETIREVWQDNLEKEFLAIQDLAEECAYVALDTEFPGVLVRQASSEYQKIKQNVENLQMIQLGLTFAKSDGSYPINSTFQFNFSFNKDKDQCSKEAIKFLEDSGIQFKDHARKGIQPADFAELMFSSQLLFNADITWVTFHGGFDFAYFLRILLETNLPGTCKDFYQQMFCYFPLSIDVKIIIQDIDGYKFLGLEKLAKNLDLERIGPMHQAGSDSLLTMKSFFRLKEKEKINFEVMRNQIFGLSELDDERQQTSQQQQQQYYDQQYQGIYGGQEQMVSQFYYQTPAINDYFSYDYSALNQNVMFNRNYSNNAFNQNTQPNNAANNNNNNNDNRGGQPRRTPSQR